MSRSGLSGLMSTVNQTGRYGPGGFKYKVTVMVSTLLMHHHTPCARGQRNEVDMCSEIPRVPRRKA